MLKELKVTRLFGLYDYDLDFSNQDGTPIKFITGPNGYGKTTILRLIHQLFQCFWSAFVFVDFKELLFLFDECEIHIVRKKIEDKDISSDRKSTKQIAVNIRYVREGEEISRVEVSQMDDSSRIEQTGKYPQEINLFLESCPRLFIQDDRLLIVEPEENENVWVNKFIVESEERRKKLTKKMQDASVTVSSMLRFDPGALEFAKIAKEEYEEARKKFIPFLSFLDKYGIYNIKLLPDYREEISSILHSFVIGVTKVHEEFGDFVNQLSLFEKIIERCDFADKTMLLDKDYGFRFVVNNDDKTILFSNDLSSGEQHMLIQLYDMIIGSERGSLILIDEPEMSHHLAWQMDFLPNLRSICNLRQHQCIVSTHSTQIFSSKWSLTNDLYRLTHPRNNSSNGI